ncbi:MAG: glycosyl transferase family 2 [Flavobacteriaceae bacterium]|nr:glycosyl transferase family 2 [Flavobacteriaceae bacterium]
MTFALIICTYMRPEPLRKLLDSVALQTPYPNSILVVDGSRNEDTRNMLSQASYQNLDYYKVSDADRGLTRQRNFGIEKVEEEIEIVCFLDDDTILKPAYFKKLLRTYEIYPGALGVGGYIANEVTWRKVPEAYCAKLSEFCYDGYCRKDGARFVLRKKLGLDANRPPAHLPDFSHGRSVSFLPPSGKIYPVEQFMGGVASYRKAVLDNERFSEYFEGYGLYEDAEFTLRLSNKGSLFVNTAAQLEHHHDASGRPNTYAYGKMVVRNGWLVWRTKYTNPSAKAKLKWHLTSLVLTLIRFGNSITRFDSNAFREALGRTVGWFTLFFNKPKAV